MATARKTEPNKGATFRDSVRALMECPVPEEEQREALETLGLAPTMRNLIQYAVVDRATRGDVTAARYLRDTAGEDPDGDLLSRPVASLDLTRLTDEQLLKLAAAKGGGRRAKGTPAHQSRAGET